MNKDLKEKFAFTLAEGATHVGIFNNTRRVGFTLAEVLITLGIIGIVSAMTIPTLLNNYKQKVLDKQFVQTYSLLSQALLLTTSQMDYMPKCYYKSIDGVNLVMPPLYSECVTFNTKLLKNLRITKKCSSDAVAKGCMPVYEGYDTIIDKKLPNVEPPEGFSSYGEYLSRGCTPFRKANLKNRPTYNLSNGSILFLYDLGMPILCIDINGFSAPNKWGHDVFSFSIINNGTKYSFGQSSCMSPEFGGYDVINKLQQLGLR